MSIIQTIRDKGAKISVALIALALVGFILTDYFSGRGRGVMGGGSKTVGVVNGKTISYDELKRKADQVEANYKQQGYPTNPAMTQEAVNQAWNQEVDRLLYRSEIDKIGMRIGKKERGDLLYGANAPEFIKKAGTDENGVYNPLTAQQRVNQMMRDRNTPKAQKDEFNNYVDDVDDYRLMEKYNSLFANSTNFPRWFVEKQTNDQAQIANIAMVRMLYTDSSLGPDSAIQISDKEIEDYIKKRKDYYQQEASRSISYVSFSASPTAADSAAARKTLQDIRPEFDTVTDVAMFIARNGNPEPPEIYYSATQLPPVGKDSIIRLSRNAVYGPYLEGGSYAMVKLLDTKVLPDSIKNRHVLISTNVEQGGVPDSVASRRIDSIQKAIAAGASWADMVQKYNPASDGSRQTNGEMTFSSAEIQSGMQSGNFAKEFGQFILWDGKVGEKKIVKTSFGYHLIEIMEYKNPQPHYKLAFLAEQIRPSQETDNEAVMAANQFFGEAKDLKTFDEAFIKTARPKGAIKGIAQDISPMAAQIGGGMTGGSIVSRSLVINIHKAKLHEVLKPEKAGDNYVVAIVTEINEKGLQPISKVRPGVEIELRKKKKAAMIKQKLGTITTLEDASAKLNSPTIFVDSVRMDISSFSQELGNEPRVKGAAFNPANKGKVAGPIEGNNGVYVIRVENVASTPSNAGSVADQRLARYNRVKGAQTGPISAIRKAAKIKDKRAEKF